MVAVGCLLASEQLFRLHSSMRVGGRRENLLQSLRKRRQRGCDWWIAANRWRDGGSGLPDRRCRFRGDVERYSMLQARSIGTYTAYSRFLRSSALNWQSHRILV